MGFRFRKSFKIAPGIRVNVGKKSVGISAGGKGFRYSVNSRTGARASAGIPGTGLYYTTSVGGKRKTSAYTRHSEIQARERELDKLNDLEHARLAVDSYENTLERIKSIHLEADDPVNWIKVRSAPPPYNRNLGEFGLHEQEATKKLQHYQPGFLAKLFKQDEKEEQKLRNDILEARRKDEEEYLAWERDIRIANKIIEGDIDTYFEVIQEFGPLEDLSEFGSGFEFFCGDAKTMEIEFEVNSDSVVPKEQLSLTKTGKLSRKQMPKGKYYDIQQDYVCSCILRIARDMFALLPIMTLYIHAVDERLNTATGYSERVTILSIKIDKMKLNRLNFNHIDSSDAMQNFEHRMSFKKTKGFEEVDRLIVEY